MTRLLIYRLDFKLGHYHRVGQELGIAHMGQGVTAAGAGGTVREMEPTDWASLSDQELLERRISKLGLRLKGTALGRLIRQVYDELSAKSLVF